MIMLRRLWLFIPVLAAGHACGAEPTVLQHDPFARPQLGLLAQENDTARATGVPDVAWTPHLTTVMVAGKDSMAVVDGTILRLGESLAGYRLVKIRDWEAIFQKDGKRIVLNILLSETAQGENRGNQ